MDKSLTAFFVSDLHGKKERYEKLFGLIRKEKPVALFMGGDLLPHFGRYASQEDFVDEYLIPCFSILKNDLKEDYPEVFLILGNDDPKIEEEKILCGENTGLWKYMHNRKTGLGIYTVYGYSCVPPTPFRNKDWERFDVSRYVDPGCIPPTEGYRTVDPVEDIEYVTISNDLEKLAGHDHLSNAIFLFHTPPYQSNLDRAALDGMMYDHVPLDLHVGSIAVRRFIETRKPWITLHGHIHESARITGSWSEKIGDTWCFNAATDGKELSVIKLSPEHPKAAERVLF